MRGLNSSSGRMLAIAAAMLAVLMSMGLSAQGGGATAGASALGPRGSVVGSVPKAGAYLGPARLSVRVEDVQASAPMTTPTAVRTNTPGPTETTVAEPEMLILQYVQTNHPGWYCQGPFGTPGHRYIRDCYTFQFGTHPARGYVDNYATESGAQTEWQQRRLYAQGAYPIFREFDYSGYPGYEAGNETFPNGHTENYFWGSIWVMGGTSQDDTNFNRGAGPIANAVYEAAAALGYLGSPTPNPSPSATFFVRTPTYSATPTGSPTGNHTPTATPTSLCLGSNPMCTTTPTHTATPCPMGFSDVSTTDFFYEPVRHLFCRGIISGYSDSTFRPYSNATRGQLVKIVILAALWPIYTPPAPTFRDVPLDHPFFGYIETAYRHNVVSGYECGPGCLDFHPENNVTRGQLAKIISLVTSWTYYPPQRPTFTDVPFGHPFFQYIEMAAYYGAVTGYGCGSGCLEFRPGNNATRGQIAKIVRASIPQP